MAKQHDKQFRFDAIQYREGHKALGFRGCANKLGVSCNILTKWGDEVRDADDIVV